MHKAILYWFITSAMIVGLLRVKCVISELITSKLQKLSSFWTGFSNTAIDRVKKQKQSTTITSAIISQQMTLLRIVSAYQAWKSIVRQVCNFSQISEPLNRTNIGKNRSHKHIVAQMYGVCLCGDLVGIFHSELFWFKIPEKRARRDCVWMVSLIYMC